MLFFHISIPLAQSCSSSSSLYPSIQRAHEPTSSALLSFSSLYQRLLSFLFYPFSSHTKLTHARGGCFAFVARLRGGCISCMGSWWSGRAHGAGWACGGGCGSSGLDLGGATVVWPGRAHGVGWAYGGGRDSGGLLRVDATTVACSRSTLAAARRGRVDLRPGSGLRIGVVVSSPPSSDYALLRGCGPRSRRWTLGLFFLNLHLGSLFFFKISLNGKLAATILLCKLGS